MVGRADTQGTASCLQYHVQRESLPPRAAINSLSEQDFWVASNIYISPFSKFTELGGTAWGGALLRAA